MKKYIFTANVIALLLLVPAVLVGYLHNDAPAAKTTTQEIAKDVNTGAGEDGSLLRLVRNF